MRHGVLTADFHHLFFGDETARYELAHAEDALYFLPYGAMVDSSSTLCIQTTGLHARPTLNGPAGKEYRRGSTLGPAFSTVRRRGFRL